MKTRISAMTPSFDPRDPPWDRIYNYPDGRFYEYGSRSLNKYDRRLTYVLLSHLPRHMVAVSGRSLEPRKNHADFLSLRIGSDRAKQIVLSIDDTAFITIKRDGVVQVERKVVSYEDFSKSIPSLTIETFGRAMIQNGCVSISPDKPAHDS